MLNGSKSLHFDYITILLIQHLLLVSNTAAVFKTTIAAAGHEIAEIEARFSPQILNLFSDHLYSSANKAFEELVTNSWDADAFRVYVHIPDDLNAPNAALYILDNGGSMDVGGLQQLWTIAESNKRDNPPTTGRKKIGKFGIGKLATYILCNELTYICKADDGIIRVVTMDYREIDEAKENHLSKLRLSVRELKDLKEIEEVLIAYADGSSIFNLIAAGIPAINTSATASEEYGGNDPLPSGGNGTWTLAILTSLKGKGKSVQRGWIKRLLSTALPLGNSMRIQVNDQPVEPSKLQVQIAKSWKIGKDLEFESIDVDGTKLMIEKKDTPYPYISIPHIGKVTGTITFYKESISGGKSGHLETSHGFYVNVLGRVVNYEDNQFKLPHLNYGVFNRLRIAIRVDGIDPKISISRESISEGTELSIVRAFLYEAFNMVRREETKQQAEKYVQLGEVRRDEISSLPLSTLAGLFEKSITEQTSLPTFLALREQEYTDEQLQTWKQVTDEGGKGAIEDIVFKEQKTTGEISTYDLVERKLIINEAHPFVKANSNTKEQKELLRDVFTADLLADAYLMSTGIPKEVYQDYFWHRDRSRRLIAQIRRSSASMIIQTLSDWSDKATPYEEIVGDALEYLGFEIKRIAGNGEPDGIATAYISPSVEDTKGAYSLTYDAKSTGNGKVQTGNVHIAGLARHRDAYKANYALVLAPDFQEGALSTEATSNKVTPMIGNTLAKLVALTVGFGPISLQKLEELFSIYDPKAVEKWVSDLESEMSITMNVSFPILIAALAALVTPDKLDRLSYSVIAQKYRELSGDPSRPVTSEIAKVLQGLALMMPSAIAPSGNDAVVILNRPDMIEKEMTRQLSDVPEALKFGTMKMAKSA